MHPLHPVGDLAELGLPGRREAHLVPDVGVGRSDPEHPRTHRGEHDRGARGLDGERLGDRAHHVVIGAVERRLLLGEHPVEDLDVLLESGDPFGCAPVLDPHHLVRRIDRQAGPEPDLQPTAGDVVHRRGLMGQ